MKSKAIGSKTSKKIIKKKTSNTKKKTNTKKIKEDDHDFETKIEEMMQTLRNNYAQQKKLSKDLKELISMHKKEIKLTKKSGNRSNSGKHSGFNKPEPVPPPLKKLLKIEDDMLPRSKMTPLMYQYFKDNKMYNTKTKREIIPNEKIKKTFGMKDGDVINFFNLQTWLKKIYDENSGSANVLQWD